MTKNEDLQREFHVYADETTLHGLHRAIRKDYSVQRRCVWVLILLAMFGNFLHVFANSIIKLTSYPSNTKTGITTQTAQQFPAITICNNNKLKKSYIQSDAIAIKWFANQTNANDMDSLDDDVKLWLEETDAITYFYEGAVNQTDIVHEDCDFSGKKMDCGDVLAPVQTITEGYCFTIYNSLRQTGNDNDTSSTLRKVQRTGPYFGMHLMINIDQPEYSNQALTSAAGIKVVIHDEHISPPIEQYGFALAPGTEVYVGLQTEEITRLPTPYNVEDCTDEFPAVFNRSSQFSNYSEDGCKQLCLAHYVRQNLGCDILGDQDYIRNCTLFEYYTGVEAAYYEVYVADNRGDNQSCGCLKPCKETKYRVQLSTMHFPSNNAGSAIGDMHGVDTQYIADNFISMMIYFQSLDLQTVKQQPSYDYNTFSADMGGQLGLFMGASFVTIAEFFEFVFIAIAATWRRATSTDQRTQTTTAAEMPTKVVPVNDNLKLAT